MVQSARQPPPLHPPTHAHNVPRSFLGLDVAPFCSPWCERPVPTGSSAVEGILFAAPIWLRHGDACASSVLAQPLPFSPTTTTTTTLPRTPTPGPCPPGYYYNRETGATEWEDPLDAQQAGRMAAPALPPHLREPPSVLAHMGRLFAQHDDDGSGELEWPEFWRVLAALRLGLSDGEAAAWFEAADLDGSGSVRWAEFEGFAGQLLARCFGGGRDFGEEGPWVELDDGRGHAYRLNRATGEALWCDPRASGERGEAAGGAAGEARAFRAPPPGLTGQLKRLFAKYDEDGSGELEPVEFRRVLEELGLGLSDEEMDRVQEEADTDGSGTVRRFFFSLT